MLLAIPPSFPTMQINSLLYFMGVILDTLMTVASTTETCW